MKRLLLLCLLAAGCKSAYAVQVGGAGIDNEDQFPTYNRRIFVPASYADFGPTGPTDSILTGDTAGEYLSVECFDADDERVLLKQHWPHEYEGNDAYLKIFWFNEAEDPIEQNETVIWKAIWWTSAPSEGELWDVGTPVTVTETYTEADDPGTDKECHVTQITLDHDHGDQQLAAGYMTMITLSRDKTNDTYPGDACACAYELHMDANNLPTSH